MIEGWGLAAAGIAAAGAIGGAEISANASSKASQEQQAAAGNATAAQMYMFNQNQSNIQPQIQLGQQSSNQLSNLLSGKDPNFAGFENQPGYQAALKQGNAAIDKQAAASGNLFSTSTLAALGNYNQGQAQQGYQTYVQNLMQAAGLGNAAGSSVLNAGTTVGGQVGSNYNLAGSAAAAGTLGQANAFSNALGSNQFGNLGGNLMGAFQGSGNNGYFNASSLNGISDNLLTNSEITPSGFNYG